MYALICNLVVLVAIGGISKAAPAPNDSSQPKVVYEVNQHKDEFVWSYKLSDETKVRQESMWNELLDGTKFLTVRGEYSYIAPNGVRYTVTYISDRNGFQPEIFVGEKAEPASAVEFDYVKSINPKALRFLIDQNKL